MIQYGDSHLSIGTLVVLPLMILIILALIGIGIWLRSRKWGPYDAGDRIWFPRICWSLAVLVLIGTLLAMYPYKSEYHHWQSVRGIVTSTNSRFLAKSSGTDQKFVVTFEASSQQFGCNDTRCSTIREGDYLEITCKRVFQFFGTPGYDCNFVDYVHQPNAVLARDLTSG